MNTPADKRIGDAISVIAARFSGSAETYSICVKAINAALADPVILASVRDAALEEVINRLGREYVDEERFGGDAEAYNSAVGYCIGAVSAMRALPPATKG